MLCCLSESVGTGPPTGRPNLGESCSVSILLPRRGQDQAPCRRFYWGLRTQALLLVTQFPDVRASCLCGKGVWSGWEPTNTWMFTPLLPTWLFGRPCRTCDRGAVPPVGPRGSPPHWAPLAVVWRLGFCQPFLREQSQQTLRCLCALGLVCVTVITSVSTIRRDTQLPSSSLLTLSQGWAQTRLSVTPAVLSPQYERRLGVC